MMTSTIMMSLMTTEIGDGMTSMISDVTSMEGVVTSANQSSGVFSMNTTTDATSGNVSADVTMTSLDDDVMTTFLGEEGLVGPILPEAVLIIYMIIGVLGVVGNVFVVVVVCSSKVLRKRVNNIFIVNQAVADFMTSISLISSNFITTYDIPLGMPAAEAYCRLWLNKFWLWSFLVVSTYNLITLTTERYLSMLHPIWHKVKLTRTMVKAMVAFPWVFGLVWNAAYAPLTSSIVDGVCVIHQNWPSAIVQQTFGIFIVIVQFFIPLTIMIYCYGRIAYMLHKRVKVAQAPPQDPNAAKGGNAAKDDRWSKASKNTIKTMFVVCACFGFCWVWNSFLFMCFNLGLPTIYDYPFYHFTVIAVFANCCINPFIYSIKYEQFKEASKKLLCPKKDHHSTYPSSTVEPSQNTAPVFRNIPPSA